MFLDRQQQRPEGHDTKIEACNISTIVLYTQF